MMPFARVDRMDNERRTTVTFVDAPSEIAIYGAGFKRQGGSEINGRIGITAFNTDYGASFAQRSMIGTTLSHYRIVEELGRGGMGIVYKAEDTKLDRTVAIKVLPSAALASKDDRERFYREAKSAAALNHPHIAQVYEIDEAVPSDAPHGTEPSPFIAMEFIDGQPLDEHVKDKPLKLPQAVALAVQIAQALEAAHDKNIVHRDIKSANVMLTAKGQAKVLDFGLAKTAHSTMLTRMGSTLGTVAYMSPEQARGEDVDHRTDLWALGVVLYEMVSGKNPFSGDYEQAVVYSILNEGPEPLTAVRTGVPMQLEWIVDKCLAKDAEDRYQSAKDLIVDLRKVDLSATSSTSQSLHTSSRPATAITAAPPSSRPKPQWLPLAAALLIGLMLASAWFMLNKPPEETPPLTRVQIELQGVSSARFSQISPTGDYLAFAGTHRSGFSGLMVRNMETGEIRQVRGTENIGVREFGFSPNGTRVAYSTGTNGGVYVVEIPNGIPTEIVSPGRYAFWYDNQTLAVTDDQAGGGDSWLVDVELLEKTLIEVDDPQLEPGYINVLKSIVPGTNRAFGIQLIRQPSGGANPSDAVHLFTLDLASGELDVIARNASNPYYIADNYIGYQIGSDTGELVVRRFDPDTGLLLGSPVNLTDLGANESWGDYSYTLNGDLLYSRTGFFSFNADLFEFDLEVETITRVPLLIPLETFPREVTYSPDGSRIAFRTSNPDLLYDYNLQNGQQTQYTFNGRVSTPRFSTEGDFLYYSQSEGADAPWKMVRTPIDNLAGTEVVSDGLFAPAFSADGRLEAGSLFRGDRFSTESTAFVVRNRQTGAMIVLDSSSTGPRFPDFSPDGRYVVVMNESSWDSSMSVYSSDGKQIIPLPGIAGFTPQFSPDGEWLYFARRNGVFRVPIRLTPTFAVSGQEEQLIVSRAAFDYDLAYDGTSVAISAGSADFTAQGFAEDVVLDWIQNFPTFLKKELGE